MMNKVYLGDGVYVTFDGYRLVLTTEDGISTTNTIYLDSNVFTSLLAYETKLRELIKVQQLNNISENL